MRRPPVALLALALASAPAACVNAPDSRVAYVSADVVDAPAAGEAGANVYDGKVEGYMVGLISADGKTWYAMAPDLTAGQQYGSGGSAALVAVPLLDTLRTPVQRGGALPLDTYRYVRLVVSAAPRENASPTPTTVRVTGTVGDTAWANRFLVVTPWTMVVPFEIAPLALGDGQRVHFEWNLHSPAWLTRAALLAGRADTALVRAAVTMTVTR